MLPAEKLYTRHYRLYNFVFMQLLHYDRGIKAFFEQSRYLRGRLQVLDAGCGSGTVIKALHEIAMKDNCNYVSYYGFDITQVMLDQFNEWIAKEQVANITTSRGDVLNMQSLPVKWQTFDLIVSSAMLEYLPKSQLPEALGSLRQRLATNGKLVVVITKQNSLNRWLITEWWKANAYTQSELETAFSNAGFQNITFKTFNGRYRFLNIWGFIVEATKL